jgi:hypothetical protein
VEAACELVELVAGFEQLSVELVEEVCVGAFS